MAGVHGSRAVDEKELSILINFIVLYGGIFLSVCLLLFLDWLGRRQKREKSQVHKQA